MGNIETAVVTSRVAERRRWWVAFGIVFAACTAWSLAVPLLTGPDEFAHANRAAAIVRGQITGVATEGFGNSVVAVSVPEAVTAAGTSADCFVGRPREAWDSRLFIKELATCERPTGGSRLVDSTTSEHRGQPFYYLLVGLPTLPFPSAFGLYLMRLVGGLLCSALLASAFMSLLRMRGNRLVVLGGALAFTPAVAYYAGTVNSVGVEIAASLALFASGAALVRGPSVDRRLVNRTGVALVVLVLSRGLSPGFAAVALGALALVAAPGRLRELVRRADVRVWGGLAAAATVVSGAWLVWVHQRFELPARPGTGLGHAIGDLSWDVRDLVAMFGSTDVTPTWVLHAAWGALALAVLVLAWRLGARRELAVAGALAAGAIVLLVSGEGLSIPDSGFWWQGRYVMSLMVGAMLLGTLGPTGTATADDRRVRDAGPPLLAGLALLHMWVFLYTVRHYSVGWRGTANPARFLTDTLWAPPLAPAAVWVVVYAAALVTGAVLLWRASAVVPAVDGPALRRAVSTYRGATASTRAFVAARAVVAPLGALTDEARPLQGRLLSLGSGISLVERYLAEVNGDLVIEGIDLDPKRVELIRATQARSPRVTLRLGDATALSEEADAWQAVLVCDAFHHFDPDTHKVLARAVADCLRPGGVCIVKDLDVAPRWKYRWNRAHDRIVAGPEPIWCRTPVEMAELLAAAGLVPERMERTDRPWTPYAHYVVRARKP